MRSIFVRLQSARPSGSRPRRRVETLLPPRFTFVAKGGERVQEREQQQFHAPNPHKQARRNGAPAAKEKSDEETRRDE